jgi:tetratricopeptide (TPR) repeat protein
MAIDPYREAVRLMRERDWPNALTQIDRVLLASPGMPQGLLTRAQCLLALGRRGEACVAAKAALAGAATDALLLDALGSFFSFAGDQDTALEAFEQAAALAPDNAHFVFNRATVRRFLGRLAAAETDYDRVIALRPADFEAYKNRSDLRTQTADRNHVAELEGLVARGFANWRSEVQIRYTLAKEYEDLGHYRKSFDQLRQGARKRRENLRYDVANDVSTVDWIIEAFAGAGDTDAVYTGAVHTDAVYTDAVHTGVVHPATPAHAAPEAAAREHSASEAAARMHAAPQPAAPIFIVGLPRSGTTLVDRILSSHSQVRSAGELNDFALALVARVRGENGHEQLPRRELVARSAHVDFAALGREYLVRARAVVAEGRFTDKMPLNYLYCGLIRRALPNAKIVHLTRHPMAAGYAMYKTLFKDGYPFSYDLDEIARYYIAYRKLMDHWSAVLPGTVYSLNYENLVADQIDETRKLLEFCGLDWEDACAEFHRNPSATTTASASQVRRPIYDSSVAQWRHYTAQLASLSSALESAGIEL